MHLSHNQNIVLLITHSGDFFTVDRVAQALWERGIQTFRLDTDKFPMSVQIAANLGNSESIYTLKYGERSICGEQVQAVWMRRIFNPNFGKELAPKFKKPCIRESLAALNGFLDSLREAHWVDDLQRINIAENKLRQLRIAAEVGLTIPQTLVTNDPQEVREFFHSVDKKMVAKLLTPLSFGMESSPFFLYTSAVKEEDLEKAQALEYSPMVFQEQIPKQLELRVVFVDGNLFVGALNASVYAEFTVDWRRLSPEACPWQTYELPLKIATRLKAFMAKFGLVFGAFDLIKTPSGEYVFLEVNPTGEWGMLERDLDYPISQAIANALVSKVRREE
ncbi:MvdC family ATP-grasp ribosomal peptide maturase [Mastigocoleus sp. MO_188.B34]|uniref:MvdC family ATP-grasp ribosomal peptide maturase n=1 Tax=Mastigocoleus sp. MO_188.B34 TaxID=3036635 RepID=UPI00262ACACB|nr:MvdC family ATP-grasp ribosomal peptide maturase [Mastigocoleus sp. MO_188.B34]MDJ0697507.1 MvdC family ATP-grasp ribosomal peptide maturase [Mastigocoleus sp. MO_188.B34]